MVYVFPLKILLLNDSGVLDDFLTVLENLGIVLRCF